MIFLESVERAGHCGHPLRYEQARLVLGDIHWCHQLTAERDLTLCHRLAEKMGLEIFDNRKP